MNERSAIQELTSRLEQLEAEKAVRAVMARYMELCDDLGPATPMDELGELFAQDAVWAGVGPRYAATFGGYEGRDAIVAMLGRYRGPPPHFAMNAHFLCSESITVDRESARGSWMMLQASTYADGRSDLRSARLRVRFVREQGEWRISRFETENLFSRAVERWDDPTPVPVPAKS
ncbi:nuclear transport factor 2 family protein [Altererythrobacter soli]|uniref:Nuclear transport factor 2 family protein n=1 Tax=Croceibacterium soli TaxID=1739690 RepID=A0A6I4UWA9_9SPHN|nr:nuclear transport factor 2 family protein [Croceibacterium soli]MXP42039.1 nuclear transport factor 2 family protein [Croceibacterium soli]